MKAAFFFITIVILAVFGCKDSPTEPEAITGEGNLTVIGSVFDNTSGDPLSGAAVYIFCEDSIVNRVTDSQGSFSAVIAVDKSEEIEIVSSYKGYYSDTTSANVVGGNDVTVDIKLQKKTIGYDVAGDPSSIVLVSTSAQSIGVKESGSVETAIVTFEVQDSSGNPINIDHSVLINFSLGSSPGGGEFISPTSVKTDDNGKAVVSISSGTKAGVVQFIAEINFNGSTILSKPVNIAIHGGHPDQNHLTVFPQYVNMPGLVIAGLEDQITALVGDKYANPVKPATAVYFTTTGGIIEGSALTNEIGEGSASLVTGNPLPNDGWVTVYVSSADENYNKISDSTTVLFSGESIITVASTFPDITHGTEATVQYSIMDANGHPIAHNNSVSVTIVQGKGVQLAGDINFTTIDTQDPDAAIYSFTIVDADTEEPLGNRAVTININVDGPNGSAIATISGNVN